MKGVRWFPLGLAACIALSGCAGGELQALLRRLLGPRFGQVPQTGPTLAPSLPFSGTWYACGNVLTLSESATGDVSGSVTAGGSMTSGGPQGGIFGGVAAGSPTPTPGVVLNGGVQDLTTPPVQVFGSLTGTASGSHAALDFVPASGSPWSSAHLEVDGGGDTLVGQTSDGTAFYASTDPGAPNPTCTSGGMFSQPLPTGSPAPTPNAISPTPTPGVTLTGGVRG